jgi:hypothetical protein
MTPLPDPAAPDALGELHATVQKWTAHIPQNLPYVDLMFAFGHATAGDRSRALALVESARKVMQVPIPATSAGGADAAVIAAVVSNFLLKAFAYRVDQALAGRPHTGPLSRELLDELEEITRNGGKGPANNAHKLAEYGITRLRDNCRIVEPQERPNVYNLWSRDALERQLADLGAIREPRELADRIRRFLTESVAGKATWEVQFRTLLVALPLAPRVGEDFTVELLKMVPGVLAGSQSPDQEPPYPKAQRELLELALFFVGDYKRRDLVKTLLDVFVDLVHSKHADERLQFVNAVAGPCLLTLKKLGLRDEIDRVIALLQSETLDGVTMPTRPTRGDHLERWATELVACLHLATGYLSLGQHDRAGPILDAARSELLTAYTVRIPPKEYVELARAYVGAIGAGPAESGLARITEMFRVMDSRAITNTWTTANYFSRFHLNVVEDAVFAVFANATEPPHVVGA